MPERRTFTRVECDLPATLEYEGESFPSQLLNLSISGALINTAASPEKGKPVTICFVLELEGQQVSMSCTGLLARAEQRGLGIEFERLSLSTFQRLRDYVASHSQDPDAIAREFDEFLRIWHEKQNS